MVDAGIHGAVSWVDLSTPDIAAATDFYAGLLGWSVETSESPMGVYHIGKVGERDAAGMMAHGPELAAAPAMWTVFVTVDDMDGAVARVGALGGTVVETPFPIPGEARVAVIADPTGAMLALIEGRKPDGPHLRPEPGSACWVELLTRDPGAAAGFYNELFGWKTITDETGAVPYTVFQLNDEGVAGMMTMPAEVPPETPAHWSVYFAVEDCAATERRAVELGGTVLRPTAEIEMGRFAVLADPQGAVFQLMENDS